MFDKLHEAVVPFPPDENSEEYAAPGEHRIDYARATPVRNTTVVYHPLDCLPREKRLEVERINEMAAINGSLTEFVYLMP